MRRLLTFFVAFAIANVSSWILAQDQAASAVSAEIAKEIDSLPQAFADDLARTRSEILALEESEAESQTISNAWGELGMIYHGQQLVNAALDAYSRALGRYEDARWHYLSSVVFLGRGETDRALAHLQQTVLLQPEYASAWYRLGNTHLLRGEFDQAREALLEAQDLDANSAAILVSLADVELELGQTEQAMDYLNQAWAASPTSGQIAYKLAQIYQEQGDSVKYQEWLTQTQGVRNPPQIDDPLLVQVAGYSRNSRFFVRAADWAIQQGDIAGAISSMKRATEVDPENTDIALDYALLLFMANQQTTAIEEVKQILARDIESSRGWYRLAWMLRKSEEPEEYLEGLVAIRKSLELDDSAESRRLSAAMFIGSGQWTEAEADYQVLLETDPENAYYLYWLGMVQLAQNNCEGVNWIKRALVVKKDFGEAHLALARAEALCGATDIAVERIEAMLSIKDDIDTRLAQAYIRMHAGNMDQVQEIAEAALPHPDAQLIMNALDANEKPKRLFELGSPWWIPQELQ